jgi:Domain of unknown function (DUF5710)
MVKGNQPTSMKNIYGNTYWAVKKTAAPSSVQVEGAPIPRQGKKTEWPGRVYLNVPYEEKDEAKALGARWSPDNKRWYVPEGRDRSKLSKWIPFSQSVKPEPISGSILLNKNIKTGGMNNGFDQKLWDEHKKLIQASSEKNAVWLKRT